MSTHNFCDAEVGILGHFLLEGADEDYFEAFHPSPSNYFMGLQPTRGEFATVHDRSDASSAILVTPMAAASFGDSYFQCSVREAAGEGSSSANVRVANTSSRPSSRRPANSRCASERSLTKSSNSGGSAKPCLVEGCIKSSQSHGLCIRHGGGKRCSVENCTRGAQVTGRCKAHGGGVRCSAEGCNRSSQGGRLCRTHGGGKLCDFPGCKKGTQRHGKCSTHGGARRCGIEGCMKIDRGGGLCGAHKKLLQVSDHANV